MAFPSLKAKIISSAVEAKEMWPGLGDAFLGGPAQTADWFSFWQASVNPDCLVAALLVGDEPVLLLPLEIVQRGLVRMALFVGGPHANCNFPALSLAHQVARDDLAVLSEALHEARPDIDLISLTRQLRALDGVANPLLQLASRENANVSLAITLDRNFEVVLGRNNAKRKKKKHRQNTRRFKEAGGYRIVAGNSPSETRTMLDNYFAWKAKRLAKAGIKNTYEPAGIKDFFHRLFAK